MCSARTAGSVFLTVIPAKGGIQALTQLGTSGLPTRDQTLRSTPVSTSAFISSTASRAQWPLPWWYGFRSRPACGRMFLRRPVDRASLVFRNALAQGGRDTSVQCPIALACQDVHARSFGHPLPLVLSDQRSQTCVLGPRLRGDDEPDGCAHPSHEFVHAACSAYLLTVIPAKAEIKLRPARPPARRYPGC